MGAILHRYAIGQNNTSCEETGKTDTRKTVSSNEK